MKRILISLTIFIAVAAAMAGQVKVFHEIAGLPGVETVTIGKAAMQIAKKSIYKGDKYISKDAMREMEGMEILTVSDAETIDSVRPVLQRVILAGPYEPLIESKVAGESSAIYTILSPEGEEEGVCRDILIVTEQPWELNIFLIKGTFNLDRIVSGNMQNAVNH